MGTIKDVYDLLKDLMQEAKKLKNQEMISLAMGLQSMFFEFKEENEKLKDENKGLKEEISKLKEPSIKEEDIKYYSAGFFTLKSEDNKLPYCSACWKTEKKVVPLSRQYRSWDCKCSRCQSKIIVLDENDHSL